MLGDRAWWRWHGGSKQKLHAYFGAYGDISGPDSWNIVHATRILALIILDLATIKEKQIQRETIASLLDSWLFHYVYRSVSLITFNPVMWLDTFWSKRKSEKDLEISRSFGCYNDCYSVMWLYDVVMFSRRVLRDCLSYIVKISHVITKDNWTYSPQDQIFD